MRYVAMSIVGSIVLGLCVLGSMKAKEEYVPVVAKYVEEQCRILREKEELEAEIVTLKEKVARLESKIASGVIAEYSIKSLGL